MLLANTQALQRTKRPSAAGTHACETRNQVRRPSSTGWHYAQLLTTRCCGRTDANAKTMLSSSLSTEQASTTTRISGIHRTNLMWRC